MVGGAVGGRGDLLLLAADYCGWLVLGVAGMVHVPFNGDTYYLDPCRYLPRQLP